MKDVLEKARPDAPWKIGFIRYDATGRLRDTLRPPVMPTIPQDASPWSPDHY